MKILLIADPSSAHTRKWLRCLTEDGHHVYMLSYHNNNEITIPNVIRVAYFKPVNKNPVIFIKHLLRLKEIISSIKPDVISCHYALGSPGLMSSIVNYHPLTMTVMGGIDLYGSRLRRLRHFLYVNFFLRFIFTRSDLITIDCEDHKRYLVNMGVPSEKIRVLFVGLGVDLNRFKEINTEKAKKDLNLEGKFVIFCPRRIVPYTNVDILIKALPLIKREIPNLAVLLLTYAANPESYLDYIKKTILDSGLERDVMFLKEVANEDMPRLYSASNCVVSISSFDGIPLTIAEALACKVPTIAYDIDSICEWTNKGENIIVIKKLSPEDMAEAVLRIHRGGQDIERMRESGAKFVREHADIEKNIGRLKELYRSILKTTYCSQ